MNILKQKATELRKKGFSYEYIAKKINISKSTSYLWLKSVSLNADAIQKLKNSQSLGRVKGQKTIRAKALKLDQQINNEALKQIKKLRLPIPYKKLLCSFLYWGEGEKSKSKIAFTNSDPVMVKTFLKLFRESFALKEEKFSAFLHLHKYHNQAKQIAFWSKVCGIPKNKIHVYNKVSFGKFIKNNYPGCISIRYNDYKVAREIYYLYTKFTELI